MFRKYRETQSLLEERTEALRQAENKLEEAVHNNTVLVNKNSEQAKRLKQINELATGNSYNRKEIYWNKIKELSATTTNLNR